LTQPKDRHKGLAYPCPLFNTPAPRPPAVSASIFISPARRFPHYQKSSASPSRQINSPAAQRRPTGPQQSPRPLPSQLDRQAGTLSPPRAFPHSALDSTPELPASLPSPSPLDFRLVPTIYILGLLAPFTLVVTQSFNHPIVSSGPDTSRSAADQLLRADPTSRHSNCTQTKKQLCFDLGLLADS
jgi:hypothetical protein